MADAKKKRVIKKVETVREKANKTDVAPKKRRLQRAKTTAKRPFSAARRIGQKEYHPVKLPDNKIGRFLTTPRKFTPAFFRNAWAELRQVVWPSRRETVNLTIAVFVFAIAFGALIAVVDFGLDKLFRDLLLK